jgi:hypothetical protein
VLQRPSPSRKSRLCSRSRCNGRLKTLRLYSTAPVPLASYIRT